MSNPSCAYLALRSTCLWNNLLVRVWFLSVLMITLCSRDSVFPSEMKVTETQAATLPATTSLGVGGVKDGKISILEGANQQSFLCLPV